MGRHFSVFCRSAGLSNSKKSQDIASQFLAGLEAIHKAGLVHRDVKPENIMLTRAGRVVVMDFGLARGPESGAGSVSGTPAYMAPEHAAGGDVDARADVYSAGVVLAEMVSPEGIKSYESRQSVWEGVRSEPAQIPDSPWAPVIQRAVARDRGRRQNSAHTLIRELEDVTLRVEGAEDLHPYPGLASFSESDAEYFFGREAEIEQMWRKLEGPARLFALVGPSGAGKSSFLKAGLIPSSAVGWTTTVCTPGTNPELGLSRALAAELSGDAQAVDLLLRFDDPDVALEVVDRWRSHSDHALLIVDQFEELFTQNAKDERRRFSDLLSRIVLETDVHVLLSMRDDFLFRCHEEQSLNPIFSELTPIGPPEGGALRRALVQPATKCGYRYEDDELVGEMLAEVEGERGALPLLAFAAARLWEQRDRETGLLTRQAYHDIGGVGGALARHAEATIDHIGVERISIVRELFRNLVTAEGTRAVREWDELLSVFDGGGREGIKPSPTKNADNELVGAGFTPARDAASDVLRELIDARLLTSYEVRVDEHEPIRQVEIIHESLLANWPRLVRWQTQDADSVQLRDELRQAARTWDEHDRTDDLLWTGSAYREFASWRERYPGGLTEIEEAFGEAMTGFATRSKRRRRIAVAATFVMLLGVLAVIGVFWRRSVIETKRAEAANLFSLAQLKLENSPSTAIAYAITGLELADNMETRRLALEALWRGPTEIRLGTTSTYGVDFSPDGRWLATADPAGGAKLWPIDGGPATALEGSQTAMEIRFSPRGDLVATTMDTERQTMGIWTVPEGRLVRSFPLGEHSFTFGFCFSNDSTRLITDSNTFVEPIEIIHRSWPVDGGAGKILARVEVPLESSTVYPGVDLIGSRFSWADGRKVRIARLDGASLDIQSAQTIEHDRPVAGQTFDQQGQHLATADTSGTVRIWTMENKNPRLKYTFSGGGGTDASTMRFDSTGSMFATMGGYLWDLAAPPDSDPLRITGGYALAFDPKSNWVATNRSRAVSFWPLSHAYPRVLRGHEDSVRRLVFTPDGRHLVSTSSDLTVRLWPLVSGSGEQPRVLYRAGGTFAYPNELAMAPDGSFVVFGNPQGQVIVLPLDGGPARKLHGFTDNISWVAVGPHGRRVAAGAGGYIREQSYIRIWDLESGETVDLNAGDGRSVTGFFFLPDEKLWAYSRPIARVWDLSGGQPSISEEIDLSHPDFISGLTMDFDPEGRRVLLGDPSTDSLRMWIQHLDTHESVELERHSGTSGYFGWDVDRNLVITAQRSGAVRVGPMTGEEPHLLLGHEGRLRWAVFSPDGRWIASCGDDTTIRLWPMPDLSKPPLHTLPREELIAKLKTLTNLRVVRDSESSTGWKLEVGPFPGWETVPTW